MQEMKIQGADLLVKELNGKRVVTFKDVDTVHRRPEGTARKRFNDNRKRFIEGVDFFKVRCSEVRPFFGQTLPNGFNPRADIVLLTETGYLMLVKSFTDDLAWNVQRELVDSYFRARVEPNEKNIRQILSDGIPTLVVDTDKLIKCAEIMAGCLEGNRPYVLNILKNLIPSVDEDKETVVEIEEGVACLPDASRKTVVRKNPCKGVPINITKMLDEMTEQGMTVKELARKAQVSPHSIGNWCAGVTLPLLQNRINICVALGKDEDFLTPKRKRNVR